MVRTDRRGKEISSSAERNERIKFNVSNKHVDNIIPSVGREEKKTSGSYKALTRIKYTLL
jgi:hypothetical protein